VVIRANGLDTEWGAADLEGDRAIGRGCGAGAQVSCAQDVLRYHEALVHAPSEMQLDHDRDGGIGAAWMRWRIWRAHPAGGLGDRPRSSRNCAPGSTVNAAFCSPFWRWRRRRAHGLAILGWRVQRVSRSDVFRAEAEQADLRL
jgi:citrate lyase subunit beta/citryl-CoA lyase